MKKLTRSALSAAVVAAVSTGGLAMTSTATAEVSANIGVVSNYYFRGVTQTDDAAAVQGGIDFEDASGFYAGTWVSNVDFSGASYELDLYLGFAGEVANGIGYDVGYVYYAYPDADPLDIDFGEIYGELSYDMFYAGLAYTINSDNDDEPFDSGDIYYYIGAGLPLPEDFSLGLTLGYYDFDVDGSAEFPDVSYTHFAANVAKDVGDLGEFSFNLEYADIDEDDDLKAWVGWSKGF